MKAQASLVVVVSALSGVANATEDAITGKYTGAFAGPGNMVGVVLHIDEVALDGKLKGRMQYPMRRGANTCPITGIAEGGRLIATTEAAGTVCDEATIEATINGGRIRGVIPYKGTNVPIDLKK